MLQTISRALPELLLFLTTTLATHYFMCAALSSHRLPPSDRQNIIGTFWFFSPEAAMLFFEFPEDARWSADRDAVEFSVILRPYEGTVRIGRRVFQHLLDQSPTPEDALRHSTFSGLGSR